MSAFGSHSCLRDLCFKANEQLNLHWIDLVGGIRIESWILKPRRGPESIVRSAESEVATTKKHLKYWINYLATVRWVLGVQVSTPYSRHYLYSFGDNNENDK